MELNKKRYKILFTLLTMTLLVVSWIVNQNYVWLYPESNFTIWRLLLSIAYLTTFYAMTYNFCYSRKFLIIFSFYFSIISLAVMFAKIIPDGNSLIYLNIVPLILLVFGIAIPLSFLDYGIELLLQEVIHINYSTRISFEIILIVALFYIVYFISRYLKNRNRKDDENEKVEDS